ncbi:SRPBCC family protein [Tsukamurella asaccharolytica]|uniref:SRPBCC family protein n=1 Tax=Tsukamurella asaccharolytica TaxID=2592067 RepID=A0A5C5R559_9ACTN|nr:SRPBCC family protein [Tsukamurella asaccharolytica]TWS17816.1 SRPBCC family protein [Tsukamurella asaccharolytica]
MTAFTVTRSTEIAAPGETVYGLIADFHEWRLWSPWEGLDPRLHREYTGPSSGPGASYAWKGNRKAGAGRMTISAVEPGRSVDVDLEFIKPMASHNRVRFDIVPAGAGVQVTWTMTGETSGLFSLIGKFVPMDTLVGKDFAKGLAALKDRSENRGGSAA